MNKEQYFWMLALGLVNPPKTDLKATHVNKCEDDACAKYVNFDLYPEFYEDIRLMYLNGQRVARIIYEKLLIENKIPCLKDKQPMKLHRAMEYIGFVRQQMGICVYDKSIKQKVKDIFFVGITDTQEIIKLLANEGIAVKRQYVNDVKSRDLKQYGEKNAIS